MKFSLFRYDCRIHCAHLCTHITHTNGQEHTRTETVKPTKSNSTFRANRPAFTVHLKTISTAIKRRVEWTLFGNRHINGNSKCYVELNLLTDLVQSTERTRTLCCESKRLQPYDRRYDVPFRPVFIVFG